MSLLIPSHKDLNPVSALEYAITVPDHRIDVLHITSDAAAKPTVSVEEITDQRPNELSEATIDRLVDQVESITDGTGREVRLLHSPGPIGDAIIRYADALQSDLIILAVSGNETKRAPNVNNAVDTVTNNAPAAFTIIQE
jgi:nucleotide-binding universal stress UspA family protein